MDPLSLTANIIAAVGAAGAAVRTMKRLKDARSAPNQVLQLLEQVADFENVVVMVERTITANPQQPINAHFHAHLESLLRRAMDQVTYLNQLADDGWIKNLEQANEGSAKALWKGWLKLSDIRKISMTLHGLQQDLVAALTVLTASELPQVRGALHEIMLADQATRVVLERNTNTLNDRIDSITEQLSTITPQLNEIRRNLPKPSRHTDPRATYQDSFETDRTRPTSSLPMCKMLCSCKCHKPVTFESPGWTSDFLGVILVRWSRVLGQPMCSEKRCGHGRNRVVKIHYYLPRWFKNQVIFLQQNLNSLENHNIHVRVSRVLPGYSPAFVAASHGDVTRFRNLLSARLASPFDVDDKGQTLLQYSLGRGTRMTNGHIDIFRLLLQQSADPKQQDQFKRSSTQLVLSRLLGEPHDTHFLALKAILDEYCDLTEDLDTLQLTPIHKVVAGLTIIDLTAQLELSTADIDIGDAWDRPPLHWAIQHRNEAAVRTLLKFGARVDVSGVIGNAFHCAVLFAGPEILELLISAAYSQVEYYKRAGLHPIHLNPRSRAGHSDDTDILVKTMIDHRPLRGQTPLSLCSQWGHYDHAKILIAHGAALEDDVLLRERSNSMSLRYAVQYNDLPITKLLLDAGANTSVKDHDKMSVLHLCGVFGNLEMIRLLRDSHLCCLDIYEKDDFECTPLEEFDVRRQEFIEHPEDPRTHDRCREAFIELLESVIPLGTDHVCTVRGPVAETAKELEVLKNAQTESGIGSHPDEEEFFDSFEAFDVGSG